MKIRMIRSGWVLIALVSLVAWLGANRSQASHPKISGDLEYITYLPIITRPCDDFTAPIIFPFPSDFPPSDLAGAILYPENCAPELPAGMSIPASGTPGSVPVGTYLWLFVYTSIARYYPQCDDALVGDCGVNFGAGVWTTKIHLGQKGIKEMFYIVLIETDETGNEFLTETMKIWAEEGDYPGFTSGELDPYVIKELRHIQVETAGE